MISSVELTRKTLEICPAQLRRISSDLSARLLQRVIQRGITFVSLYFLVRYLSKDAFGVYQFAAVAVSAVAFATLPGLDNAVMQSVSRGSLGLYKRATRASFLVSFSGSMMLVACSIWATEHQPSLCLPLIVAAALFPLYSGIAQWKSVLLGELRIGTWSAIEISTAVATSGFLLAAVFLNVRSLAVFVACSLLPSAAVNVWATAVQYARCEHETAQVEDDKLFRYGIHTSGFMVISIVAEQMERIVIFLVISPAALAVYYAGDRISEIIRSVFQDIAGIMAPRFARMSSYTGNISRFVSLSCVIVGAMIIVFAFTLAPAIMIFLFGKQYAPSIVYGQALLCSVAVGNVGQFQFRFIRSQADSRAFAKIIMWTSGTRIVTSILLVPIFGVWGAVASVFIQRAVTSLSSSIVIRRNYSANEVVAVMRN